MKRNGSGGNGKKHAFEYMRARRAENVTPDALDTLKHRTLYGREKENLIYPIALANLVLHSVDEPHLWHGNTLTGGEIRPKRARTHRRALPMKAVNPNAKAEEDTRTPEEILDLIEQKQKEIAEAIGKLRAIG